MKFFHPIKKNSLSLWLSTLTLFLLAFFLLGRGESFGDFGKKQDGLVCQAIPPLMRAFARAHVAEPDIQEAQFIERVANQFVKRLDPSKTILWQQDVDGVLPIVKKFFSNFNRPDCKDIESVQTLLEHRLEEQLAYSQKILDNPNYKLDENAEIVLDADKRKFPQSKQESEKMQLTQIHFQISNYLMTDMKLSKAKQQLIHRYELNLKHIKELSQADIYNIFLNSFATSLDPHSTYYSRDELEDFQISMRLSLEGIGASLSSENGYTVIQKLIPGGSAAKAKQLKHLDKIIAVGQGQNGALVSVIDMDLRDVVKLIRGKAGSVVRLSILRDKGDIKRFNVTLVRSQVKLEEEAVKVSYFDKMLGSKKLKLAKIELPSFYGDPELKERSSYMDMLNAVKEVNKKGVDGLILDFSSNGGGRLEEAVRIAGLFIKKGDIVATEDSQKRIQKLPDEDPDTQYTGPLVILTTRLSASASEIVAGALKNLRRAVIVGGDHTYGKGSVQAVLPLDQQLGAMKVTTGLFFIPGGNSTQHQGVTADVALPSIFSTKDFGEKYSDYSLPPTSISSTFFDESEIIDPQKPWEPINNSEIKKLQELSAARVAKNQEFTEVKKELKESEERNGVLKLAELRKKDEERKAKEKKKKGKSADDEDDALAEKKKNKIYIDESLNVLADLISLQRDLPNTIAAEENSLKKKVIPHN